MYAHNALTYFYRLSLETGWLADPENPENPE